MSGKGYGLFVTETAQAILYVYIQSYNDGTQPSDSKYA